MHGEQSSSVAPSRRRAPAGALLPSSLIAVGTAIALLSASPCGAALVINEVLYDPVGSDSGFEFVEIANTGPYAATLDGVALEAGNGGKPDDWKEVWRGGAEVWIQPGGSTSEIL